MKIGVDLTKIDRFNEVSKHFIERIYSDNEMKEYYMLLEEKQATYLASRWAVKEALFKAIKIANYKEYSIMNDETGQPYVENHPEIKVSISHEDGYCIAFVLVE